MEPDNNQKKRETEVEESKQKDSSPEQTESTLPFASEGLEQVRDSHC
jgi:hypothetical protein